MTKTLGAREADAWMRALDAHSSPTHERWYAEIAMSVANARPPTDFDEAIATRLHINIYSEEWGLYICHRERSSWLRVTDVAFVHGRDDFRLLPLMPSSLAQLGTLVRRFETDEGLRFERTHASITTNVESVEPNIRRWLASL